MRILHIDFETYSACELKDEGMDNYVKHPSTGVHCMAFAFDDGRVGLELPPDGLTISFLPGDEPLARARQDAGYAVVGAATAGPVRDAFIEYVGRIRSGPVRPVTVFNTWYDMQNETLTEASARERMATLKAKLFDPFGLRLDSFVLDDGWDTHDKLWTIHPVRFHGDFRPLVKSLTEQGSSLSTLGSWKELPW